jgi:hypothetical protein
VSQGEGNQKEHFRREAIDVDGFASHPSACCWRQVINIIMNMNPLHWLHVTSGQGRYDGSRLQSVFESQGANRDA